VYLLFCLGHGDAWPAGDLAVQEAIKIGLGLKMRPNAKQMAPLAEPWRPLRGAAAHLWWSYYRAIKKREGVIAGDQETDKDANAVSNIVAVAKRRPAGTRMATATEPGSNHASHRFRRRPK
jgi:DNA-3-methyladenine glycosylase II